jgi:biopolymer transport protein ExbB
MNSKTIIFQLLLSNFIFLTAHQANAQPAGLQYVKQITIQESMIPGTTSFTDFPLLISTTDNDLRSTANGGHVSSTLGYDIQFYLFACNVKLDHQLEEYNPVTGKLTAWVRIPFLSATANTNLYIYYGNDTITVDPSVNTVWNSNYQGVWHFNNSPALSVPQVTDYTGNGRNGTTNGGMTAANLITGKIGTAYSFDESNDYIRIPDFLYGQEHTVSFWFNTAEVNGNAYQYLFSHGSNPKWDTTNSLHTYIGENNVTGAGGSEIHNRDMIKSFYRDSNDWWNYDTLNAGNTFIDGSWHYYTFRVQDFGGASVFIDGNLIKQYSVWGANTFNPTSDIFIAARYDLNSQRYFGGMMDEVRIANGWRSSDWIKTEYNNQNDPFSFYIIGTENLSIGQCSLLPVSIYGANAIEENNHTKIFWNCGVPFNDYSFSIYRSASGYLWNEIKKVSTRDGITSYTFEDAQPLPGISFYQVKLINSNEEIIAHSEILKTGRPISYKKAIALPSNVTVGSEISIQYNPEAGLQNILLFDNTGTLLHSCKIQNSKTGKFNLQLSQKVKPGILYIKLNYSNSFETLRLMVH